MKNMKNINLIILVLFFFTSCEKYDDSSFDYTVSVNKSEYERGESIIIDIQGGMEKSLIYPIIAKYNSNGDLIDYIHIFNNTLSSDDCCIDNNFTTYYSNDGNGLICNCDINGVIIHTPDTGRPNTPYIYYPSDNFYWSYDQFKILIIDPFIEDDERKEEFDLSPEPTNDNIISESEFFSINNTSSTCSSPQNLEVYPGLNTATISWNNVPEAYRYAYRYKTILSDTWTNSGTNNVNSTDNINTQELILLEPNIEYLWEVQTICNQSGTEVSAWSTGNTFSTLSSMPCHVLNCESLVQLSDYEAYTSSGSNSWTSDWVVNSSNGSNNGSYFATLGNYCVGGYIEFNINLSSPSKMSYYSRKNNYTPASATITVDGISFGQSSLPLGNDNYFGHYITNDFISPGNHTIRLEFPAGGTFNTYYIDEIEFFCN